MKNKHPEIFHRHKLNPILKAENWPYPINSVFNAGAALLPDGTTLLLCRVEDRRGLSHLCAARSANGVDGWKIDLKPTLFPDPENFPRATVPVLLWRSQKISTALSVMVLLCRRKIKMQLFFLNVLMVTGL